MLRDIQERANNDVSQDTPYAIAKLEESARVIRQSISELPALRRRLEKNKDDKIRVRDIYSDMLNQHRRLMDALNAATLSLLEAAQSELADHSVKLVQSIKSFNLMTPDYSKLCGVLNSYLNRLPFVNLSTDENAAATDTAGDIQTTNAHIIGRLMNNVRMGYYPTCLDNLAHISRGIEFPDEATINLLDPCCGCGLALHSLADAALNNGCDCKTYGVELDNFRAEEASTRIDRMGFGSYFHSRVSHEAFHAMLLNPPYLSIMSESGSNVRTEKKFLVDSYKNLMIGGLLIYIIPYYRLTADVARILCDNFSDISLWKFTSDEFKKFKQVAVLGVRQKKIDGAELVSSLSSLVLKPDTLPELTELPTGRYLLPPVPREVPLFKGAQFNEKELAEQLSSSKSFSRLFQRSKLDNITKRPLLPLSIGQIGLVGGSGLINGLVECDTPHIIKGRIVKEKRVRTDDNTNSKGDLKSTTLTEVISNKLIFNLLTPNGFVSLTDYGNNGDDVDDGIDEVITTGINADCVVADSIANKTTAPANTSNAIVLAIGRTVITSGAHEILTESDIYNAIQRHRAGDWGTVSESDWVSNDYAVKNDERVLSSFHTSDGEKFWVITEWDRSATTVLLPSEY